jgi:taurine transport system ATP-binding protein
MSQNSRLWNEVENKGISLENISLTYPDDETPIQALRDIHLKLYKEDFVCVLGPSGCGKSSLLNIISGYVRPTTGTIKIDGTYHTKPNRKVGVVFQHDNLFPWLSIAKNIEFGLKMAGIPKRERKQKAAYYLKLVGLEEYAALLPHQLSGGMKQRAAIARTLVLDPEIVLLDEPFSALDALTRESMQIHLRELSRHSHKCFFFITHDVEEALLLSNRILIMHPSPGRIVYELENPIYGITGLPINEIRSMELFVRLRSDLLTRISPKS